MRNRGVHLNSGVVIRPFCQPDGMTIRIDRPSGMGLPLYETFVLTNEEIEGLKVVLAFADSEDEANASIRKL